MGLCVSPAEVIGSEKKWCLCWVQSGIQVSKKKSARFILFFAASPLVLFLPLVLLLQATLAVERFLWNGSQEELLFTQADGSEHWGIFTTLTGFFAGWAECCNLNKESHVSSTKEIQLNGGLYSAIVALFLISDLMWLHSVSCGCKPCFRGGACMHRVPFRGWIIEYFNILYLSWNEAFMSQTSQRKLKRSRIQAKFHRQKKYSSVSPGGILFIFKSIEFLL